MLDSYDHSILIKQDDSLVTFGEKIKNDESCHKNINSNETYSVIIETSQETFEKMREPSVILMSMIPKTFSSEVVIDDDDESCKKKKK
jgi:hypothetical protein